MGYYNNKQVLFFDSVWDIDAVAFINATGITDATQKSAINSLVKSLKAYNIWTKLYAFYPFIGGTSTTHKFNLKNPVDSDAAFRLTFSGTITHDSNGITTNGTSFADTKFVPNTSGILNDFSMGIYSRTNVVTPAAIRRFMGASDSTTVNRTEITILTVAANFLAMANADLTNVSGSIADSLGLLAVTRLASVGHSGYKNGSLVGTPGVTSTGRPSYSLYIGGRNQAGTMVGGVAINAAGAYISTGLNSTESSNIYTAIQNFETALGRQV